MFVGKGDGEKIFTMCTISNKFKTNNITRQSLFLMAAQFNPNVR